MKRLIETVARGATPEKRPFFESPASRPLKYGDHAADIVVAMIAAVVVEFADHQPMTRERLSELETRKSGRSPAMPVSMTATPTPAAGAAVAARLGRRLDRLVE